MGSLEATRTVSWWLLHCTCCEARIAASLGIDQVVRPRLGSPDANQPPSLLSNRHQFVDLAKNDQRDYIVCVAKTVTTLKNIHKLYLVLHNDTDTYYG